MWKPADRPEPYWKSHEEWYEFFHFVCPGCKVHYVADQGSDHPPRYQPRPVVVHARWDPSAAPVRFEATVICACMVRFETKA